MPLLLGYLSSLNQAKVGHVTKAFYALENFMENLGKLWNSAACTLPTPSETARFPFIRALVYRFTLKKTGP